MARAMDFAGVWSVQGFLSLFLGGLTLSMLLLVFMDIVSVYTVRPMVSLIIYIIQASA